MLASKKNKGMPLKLTCGFCEDPIMNFRNAWYRPYMRGGFFCFCSLDCLCEAMYISDDSEYSSTRIRTRRRLQEHQIDKETVSELGFKRRRVEVDECDV